MKNLENYGVVSLNNREMKEVDGGFLLTCIFFLTLGFIVGALIADSE